MASRGRGGPLHGASTDPGSVPILVLGHCHDEPIPRHREAPGRQTTCLGHWIVLSMPAATMPGRKLQGTGLVPLSPWHKNPRGSSPPATRQDVSAAGSQYSAGLGREMSAERKQASRVLLDAEWPCASHRHQYARGKCSEPVVKGVDKVSRTQLHCLQHCIRLCSVV